MTTASSGSASREHPLALAPPAKRARRCNGWPPANEASSPPVLIISVPAALPPARHITGLPSWKPILTRLNHIFTTPYLPRPLLVLASPAALVRIFIFPSSTDIRPCHSPSFLFLLQPGVKRKPRLFGWKLRQQHLSNSQADLQSSLHCDSTNPPSARKSRNDRPQSIFSLNPPNSRERRKKIRIQQKQTTPRNRSGPPATRLGRSKLQRSSPAALLLASPPSTRGIPSLIAVSACVTQRSLPSLNNGGRND